MKQADECVRAAILSEVRRRGNRAVARDLGLWRSTLTSYLAGTNTEGTAALVEKKFRGYSPLSHQSPPPSETA